MPSGHTRRKDDTWTSEELNTALKGSSKHEMLRRKTGDEEGARPHRSDHVNSSNRKRDPDGRSRNRDEDDKKSRRHRVKGDSLDRQALTEEKTGRPKERQSEKMIGDDQHDDVRKTRHRDEDHPRDKLRRHGDEPNKHTTERRERQRFQEEGYGEHRRHGDSAEGDARKRRPRDEGSLSRRQKDDSNQQTRQGENKSRPHEDKKDRQQTTDREESRLHPRVENDDEEERERRRQERREKREHQKNKNKEKEREKHHGSRVRAEIPERDQTGSRRKQMDIDKDIDKDIDRDIDKDKDHKERDRDKRHKDRYREKGGLDIDMYKDEDIDRDRYKSHKDRDKDKSHKDRDRDKRHKDRDRDNGDKDRDRDKGDKDRDRNKGDKFRDRDKGDTDRDRDRQLDFDRENGTASSRRQESERRSRRPYDESAQVSSSPIGPLKSEGHTAASGDDDDYEEDFEDYDDDFEDASGALTQETSEVGSVLRALDEENRLTASSQRFSRAQLPNPSEDNPRGDASPPVPARPKKSFINFVSAKQRVLDKAVAGTARKRLDDLSKLIELDVVKFDMFDLQPVKEYDMYIRSFGRSDTKQAYVQTRDDDIDKDVQTEEANVLSKWTQHPSNEEMAVGGEGISVQGSDLRPQESSKIDVVRLSQFLDRTSRILFTILDEESKGFIEDDRQREGRPLVSFCNNSSQLGMPNFLIGRQVIVLSFCQSEPGYLLSVHSTPDNDSQKVESPMRYVTVACIWKLSQPAYPYRICGSQTTMTCACFSPTKASLVFAGMSDGSVSLWDLREPSSDHRNIKVEGVNHLVRFPTYNTARVLEQENHHSPVAAIVPVSSNIVGSQKSEQIEESRSGLSFQLASVEENAVVNLWVVAEVTGSDPAGSETDLGLSPGGKLKLLRSSSISLSNPEKYQSLTLELRAVNLNLDPHDLNHFYVGTDHGHIIHGVRFGKRAYPYSHCSAAGSPVPVVSLDFSPFGQAYFLAAYEDGTLHLFNTKLENPIATWQGFISGETILCVRWSHSRATVFFVLDNSSTIFTFDLIENSLGPVTTDKMPTASVKCMEVGGDPNLLTPGSSRPANMAMALSSGTIELLTVSDEMRKPQPLDEEFLSTYVDRY